MLILAVAAEGWYHRDLKYWARATLIVAALLAFSAWDIAGVAALLSAGVCLLSKRFWPLLKCSVAAKHGGLAKPPAKTMNGE
ncbi:hypothetical protein D3C80_2094870 [compost metagenome]